LLPFWPVGLLAGLSCILNRPAAGLLGCVTGWLPRLLAFCLTGVLSGCISARLVRLPGWLGMLAFWLVLWMAGFVAGWILSLAGWSCCLAGQLSLLVGRLAGLVGWFAGSLAGLVGFLDVWACSLAGLPGLSCWLADRVCWLASCLAVHAVSLGLLA
jgi:hypothetical protein